MFSDVGGGGWAAVPVVQGGVMTGMGVRARRVAAQKTGIGRMLRAEPMTAEDLAHRLSVSVDTVRNRLGEMRAEGCPVRIAGWRLCGTAMAKVWGMGADRDVPKPPFRILAAARTDGGKDKRACQGKDGTVRFRHDGLDEWLFRIRGLR